MTSTHPSPIAWPRRPPIRLTWDWITVAALCLGALAAELHLSTIWLLGFDETWHVFIAAVAPYEQFVREMKWESHPPLHYVLLRWLTPLDASILWPRLVSIVPSLVTIGIAFQCARVMRLAKPVALLSALIFAMSSAHLNLAIAVRAYSLGTMWTMLAYYFFLRMLANAPGSGRDGLAFAVSAALAAWSEYSALLFVAAALVAMGIEVSLRPAFGRQLWRTHAVAGVGAVVVLVAALAGLARWMDRAKGTGIVGHLPPECFPRPDESLLMFAIRGAVAMLDHFAPIGLSSDVAPYVALALTAGGMTWLGRLYGRSTSDVARVRRSAIAILFVVWVALFVLASSGLYPYGGRMRHQFVVFPFLAFLLLLMVEELSARLPAYGRAALWLVVVAWTVATSVTTIQRGQTEEFASDPAIWQPEIETVLEKALAGDALYAGRLNVVALFSHRRDRTWTGREHRNRRDLFLVEGPSAPAEWVLRESSQWWLPSPLDDAATARLAAAMRDHGFASTWVLSLVLEHRPVTPDRLDHGPIRALLARHGLQLDQRVVFVSGEAMRVTRTVSAAGG